VCIQPSWLQSILCVVEAGCPLTDTFAVVGGSEPEGWWELEGVDEQPPTAAIAATATTVSLFWDLFCIAHLDSVSRITPRSRELGQI